MVSKSALLFYYIAKNKEQYVKEEKEKSFTKL